MPDCVHRSPVLHRLLLGAVVLAFATPAWAQPKAPESARNAAMADLARPSGIGGCVFLASDAETRRTVIVAMMSRPSDGPPPALKAAAETHAQRCTGRPYSGNDTAYVGAVIAAFRKAAVALAFAQQYGLSQKRLDAAWADAPAAEKAAFLAVGDDFVDPKRSIVDRELDTGPFARRLNLPESGDPQVALLLRIYYLNTGLSERAEARFRP
jgi:hypothetical protein